MKCLLSEKKDDAHTYAESLEGYDLAYPTSYSQLTMNNDKSIKAKLVTSSG